MSRPSTPNPNQARKSQQGQPNAGSSLTVPSNPYRQAASQYSADSDDERPQSSARRGSSARVSQNKPDREGASTPMVPRGNNAGSGYGATGASAYSGENSDTVPRKTPAQIREEKIIAAFVELVLGIYQDANLLTTVLMQMKNGNSSSQEEPNQTAVTIEPSSAQSSAFIEQAKAYLKQKRDGNNNPNAPTDAPNETPAVTTRPLLASSSSSSDADETNAASDLNADKLEGFIQALLHSSLSTLNTENEARNKKMSAAEKAAGRLLKIIEAISKAQKEAQQKAEDRAEEDGNDVDGRSSRNAMCDYSNAHMEEENRNAGAEEEIVAALLGNNNNNEDDDNTLRARVLPADNNAAITISATIKRLCASLKNALEGVQPDTNVMTIESQTKNEMMLAFSHICADPQLRIALTTLSELIEKIETTATKNNSAGGITALIGDISSNPVSAAVLAIFSDDGITALEAALNKINAATRSDDNKNQAQEFTDEQFSELAELVFTPKRKQLESWLDYWNKKIKKTTRNTIEWQTAQEQRENVVRLINTHDKKIKEKDMPYLLSLIDEKKEVLEKQIATLLDASAGDTLAANRFEIIKKLTELLDDETIAHNNSLTYWQASKSILQMAVFMALRGVAIASSYYVTELMVKSLAQDPRATADLGTARTLLMVYQNFLMGVVAPGTSIFTSGARGEVDAHIKPPEELGRALQHSLVLAGLASAPLLLTLPVVALFFTAALNPPSDLNAMLRNEMGSMWDGTQFIGWQIVAGAIFEMMWQACARFDLGNENRSSSALVNALDASVMCGLTYLFMSPDTLNMGLAGAAYAFLFAKIAGLIFFACHFSRNCYEEWKLFQWHGLDFTRLKELMWFGLPIGASTAANYVTTAANQIILNHAPGVNEVALNTAFNVLSFYEALAGYLNGGYATGAGVAMKRNIIKTAKHLYLTPNAITSARAAMALSLATGLVFGAIAVSAAPQIIGVIFDPKSADYTMSVLFLGIMAVREFADWLREIEEDVLQLVN